MSAKIKHIYLVRHGETFKNRTNVHQGPSEPLTELGKSQAKQVSNFLVGLNPDILLSSNYTRALQTANIISARLQLPVVTQALLHEFRRPNNIYDKHHFSLASLGYVWSFCFHRHDPDWNNDSAENLLQVQARIRATKVFLESQPENILVAVTHSIYMDMFKRQLPENKPLSIWQFISEIIFNKRIPNTGVLHFTFDPSGDSANSWHFIEEIHPRRLDL